MNYGEFSKCPFKNVWIFVKFWMLVFKFLQSFMKISGLCKKWKWVFSDYFSSASNNLNHVMIRKINGRCLYECDQFVTDGHFQKVWRPDCENKWLDVMVCFMIYCEGYHYNVSVLNVYTIWLPWLLIYMGIHEMFNIADGCNIIFGVDFLLFFFHFYLKSLDSPNIFNYRC